MMADAVEQSGEQNTLLQIDGNADRCFLVASIGDFYTNES